MIWLKTTHYPRALWILFLGTFINRFGTFVNVFLILYMTTKGYSSAQAGLAVSTYGIGGIGASALGGYFADRLGRRNTIVLSMFSSAATMLMLALAPNLLLIILLVGLAGITTELYRPASGALIADLVPSERAVTAYAVYRLSINLGFTMGPTIAGLLASHSFFLIFLGDALTSICFGLLALFALPAGIHSSSALEHTQHGLFRSLRKDRSFQLMLVASLAIAFVFFQHLSTFALQVHALGMSSASYGVLLSLNGLIIVFCELPISIVTQRLSRRLVIAVGMVLVALGFALIAFLHTFLLLALTVAIWTLGEMIYSPVATAYVADLAPLHLRGRYQGAWGITWSGGLILGPLLGAFIFSWSPMCLWLLCGGLGILAALCVLASGRHGKSIQPGEQLDEVTTAQVETNGKR